MSTEEGNILIALFDGKVKEKSSRWWRGFGYKQHHGFVSVHEENLQYHSSWDWLMPVVEKIIVLKREHNKEDLLHYKNVCSRLTPIINELSKINLSGTWFCVVKFIEWLNKETKVERSVATEDPQ